MITKPIMLNRLDPEMCNQTSINNQSHKQCYGTGYCISCTRTCIQVLVCSVNRQKKNAADHEKQPRNILLVVEVEGRQEIT